MLKQILAFGVTVLMVGCEWWDGDGKKKSSPETDQEASVGIFLDSLVEGLRYETASFSGFTNSAGEYNYSPGETVTFYIGDIIIGSVEAGPVVTPLSLVPDAIDPTDLTVTNIVRLLLTLDNDSDPSNGIEITSTTSQAAAGLSIDFSAPDLTLDPGVNSLITSLLSSPTIVDAPTAQAHFSESLAAQSSWGGMTWGSGTFRSSSP